MPLTSLTTHTPSSGSSALSPAGRGRGVSSLQGRGCRHGDGATFSLHLVHTESCDQGIGGAPPPIFARPSCFSFASSGTGHPTLPLSAHSSWAGSWARARLAPWKGLSYAVSSTQYLSLLLPSCPGLRSIPGQGCSKLIHKVQEGNCLVLHCSWLS